MDQSFTQVRTLLISVSTLSLCITLFPLSFIFLPFIVPQFTFSVSACIIISPPLILGCLSILSSPPFSSRVSLPFCSSSSHHCSGSISWSPPQGPGPARLQCSAGCCATACHPCLPWVRRTCSCLQPAVCVFVGRV